MKKILIIAFIGLTCFTSAVSLNAKAQIVSYPASYPVSFPSSYPVAKPSVIITELYPSPDSTKGEEEWIEIYNFGELDLHLKGMYFKERASSGTGYASTVSNLPDDVIKSRGYYLIKGSMLKVSLNNSGDEITLFDSINQVVDVVKYDSVTSGISFSRVFDKLNSVYLNEFQQDTILTPLEENRFPVPAEKVYLDILSAKLKPAGTGVNISGTVTVEKDLLGDTQFYIQDSTGGIKVDLYSGVEYAPRLWEKLRLTGEIQESSGEKKLVISRVEDIESGGYSAPFSPQFLGSGANLDSKLGQYVNLEGTIANNYSTSFDLNSAAGLIRVSILSSTGISIPEKSKDDIVHAAGTLVKVNGIYKVLPRYQPDLDIQHPEPLDDTTLQDSPKTLSAKKSLSSKSSSSNSKLSSNSSTAAKTPEVLAAATSSLSLPSTTIYTLPDDPAIVTIELWPVFVIILFIESFVLLYRYRESIISQFNFYIRPHLLH